MDETNMENTELEDITELMQDAMEDFSLEELDKTSKRKEQIPIKKAKFLTAIGKSTGKFDDEHPEQKHMSLFQMIRFTTNLTWKDSEVTNRFNNWKEPEFVLSTYLDCAEYVYLSYFGSTSVTDAVHRAMVYVMAHARDFADPNKRLIKFNKDGANDDLAAPSLPNLDASLPNTLYAVVISECFTQLRSDSLTDTEEVYQRLNANITYLILLMVRRTVKTEKEFLNSLLRPGTQSSYMELCPYLIPNQFPIISAQLNTELQKMLKGSAMICLVMMALLQCDDEKTKQILNVTCLNHLEWTGLVFPKLFFKVAKLYNVSEAEFWDLLCTDKTFDSLCELSDIYYKQYKTMIDDPSVSYKLFPYGRAVNIEYDTDLSHRNHFDICYTLAYLHDLHFGLDKSFARKAHWAQAIKPKSPEDELAMKVYNELKRDV